MVTASYVWAYTGIEVCNAVQDIEGGRAFGPRSHTRRLFKRDRGLKRTVTCDEKQRNCAQGGGLL